MRKKSLVVAATVLLTTFFVTAQEKLYPNEFPLSDVKLLDGPFKHAMDLNVSHLLKYNTDRLLYCYRADAGLSTKGVSNYSNWAGLDGHVGGHYLSALAIHYASTGDAQCKQRMDYMIDELKKCQDANAKDADFVGYVSGIPNGKPLWREIKKGNTGKVWDYWVPWYNIHKTYAGLRDAWAYGGSDVARQMFLKLCDWGINICSGLSENQIQSMLGNEHGGINEVYADAYQMTNDTKYLNMAKKLSHKTILTPLSSGTDNLDKMHANTQVPKAVGFQRIAELGNDNTHFKAASFFWETVTGKRSLAFGGNSLSEHFPTAAACVDYTTTREGPETCNSHNMLKLSEGLFRMTNDAKYADYYERTMFNHILSSQHPTHGGYVYFTPARPRHYRVYSAPDKAMWCCVGTGMENHGKYNQFIYTHKSDSLFVNLFVASELNWKEKGVKVKQETRIPDEERTVLTISVDSPVRFRMLIRHPSWVPAGAMKVVVGTETITSQSQPSSYFEVDRTWNGGEVVTVQLPMHTTLEQMPNVPSFFALMHGPILLGAKTETSDLSGLVANEGRWEHVANGSLYPLDKAPVLLGSNITIPAKLERTNSEEMSFTGNSLFGNWTGAKLVLQPFFRIHDSRYMIYWSLNGSGNLDEEEALILDKRTVDKVAPGEQQPEVDHQMQSLNSKTGTHQDKFYRDAGECSGGSGGFFSYVLSTNKETDLSLLVQYWGNESCTRTFDILIDEAKLVTENISGKWNKNEFVHQEYSIPNSMITGKDEITVKFQASSGMVGGVYYVRLLRKDAPVFAFEGLQEKSGSGFSVHRLSDGALKLSFGKKDPSRRVAVFSLSGKRIAEMAAVSENLILNRISAATPKGIYTIQIKSGKQIISKKIHLL